MVTTENSLYDVARRASCAPLSWGEHKLCKTPANQCTLTLLPFGDLLSENNARTPGVGLPSQPSRRLRGQFFDAGPLSPGFMLGLFFEVCPGRVLAGDGAGKSRGRRGSTILKLSTLGQKAATEPADACRCPSKTHSLDGLTSRFGKGTGARSSLRALSLRETWSRGDRAEPWIPQ
jgi:hypothetical protein